MGVYARQRTAIDRLVVPNEMSSEVKPEIRLEIGHVFFIDIVDYSKLLITEESEQMQRLREIVRGTEQFHAAEAEGKLRRLPTGYGGALVFRTSPQAPVLCALEIRRELKKYPEPSGAHRHSQRTGERDHRSERTRNIAGPASTSRNGSWTAAAPATFCSPSMSLKIWSNIRAGARSCTTLVNAK